MGHSSSHSEIRRRRRQHGKSRPYSHILSQGISPVRVCCRMPDGVLSVPEPYEGKLSCTVPRGGKCSNALTYPTRRGAALIECLSESPPPLNSALVAFLDKIQEATT